MSQALILVTNDDGISAPGLRVLVEVAQEFGEVVVVAPDSPRSGQGHAITIEHPLRIHEVETFEHIKAYECTGTPVDCVKLAKHVVLKDRDIAFCVSGINHGSNAGVNIIYSGTMSAAMEASLEGIPSVGFSLLDFSWEADMEACKPTIRKVLRYGLEHGLGKTNLLNVNIPKPNGEPLRGLRVCRQAGARWVEEFQEGTDPQGRPYYWLSGKLLTEDSGPGTDIHALGEGYVSVVPCAHDLTDHPALASIKSLESLS